MAIRKAGTGTVTTRPDIGKAPRPKVATGALSVEAQGALLKDDDRLIIAVRVRDAEGAPVVGLKDSAFTLWQLGHVFDEIGGIFVVELDSISGLEGLYHVVRDKWSLVPNGTIPFYVRVARSPLSTGGALTFVVKVRDGLDV